MSDRQNYRNTYLLSLFVWSVLGVGVLVAAPKVMAFINKTVGAHDKAQVYQAYVVPLQNKVAALEAEQDGAIAQQAEIDAIKEMISVIEKSY